MNFDRLGTLRNADAWAEQSIVSGFTEHWDRELHGLNLPDWRKSVLQIAELAYHHFGRTNLVVGDMGCGAGVYARHLLAADIPCEYHGFDHNEHVLQAACQRWEFLPHEKIHFHLLDSRVTPWPLDADRFDLLIWDSTLRFCEDIPPILKESGRVCRGWVVLARTPLYATGECDETHYYAMKSPSTDWRFSEALLRRLTAAADLRLYARLGCEDTHILSRDPLPKGMIVRPVPRLVRTFHESYVRERVRLLFENSKNSWAIYPAGAHSRWLWSILPCELQRRIAFFLDDHSPPGSHLGTVPVVPPSELSKVQSCEVLISSDTQEEALHAKATSLFADVNKVHRLYEGLPPGPYDKSVVTLPDVFANSSCHSERIEESGTTRVRRIVEMPDASLRSA